VRIAPLNEAFAAMAINKIGLSTKSVDNFVEKTLSKRRMAVYQADCHNVVIF
jgi:hypothetical protein